MGHSILGADSRLDGRRPSKWVSVVTLDGALASLQKHVQRRPILKIDAESFEPNIIAGAKSLLRGGRVALIIWECGSDFVEGRGRAAMVQMVAFLSECGFRHFQSPENSIDAHQSDLTRKAVIPEMSSPLHRSWIKDPIFDGRQLLAAREGITSRTITRLGLTSAFYPKLTSRWRTRSAANAMSGSPPNSYKSEDRGSWLGRVREVRRTSA